MKKFLSALTLCAVTLTATAQQYTIEGTAPEGVLKVFIKNFESKSVDSTFVSQGKFSFKGDAEGKMFAQVYTDDRRDVYVVLDGNVNINFTDATVAGSEDNNLMSQWKKRLETNEAEIKSIMQQYQAKKQAGESDEALKPLIERYNALSAETSKNIITLCETHTNLKFPALFLAFYFVFVMAGNLNAGGASVVFSAVVIFTFLYAVIFTAVFFIKKAVKKADESVDKKYASVKKATNEKPKYSSLYKTDDR